MTFRPSTCCQAVVTRVRFAQLPVVEHGTLRKTAQGRVRLYGRLGSRHSGLSGAEGLLTATLLTDTEQWTNGSKGRIAVNFS